METAILYTVNEMPSIFIHVISYKNVIMRLQFAVKLAV
jgi:hypothetical protein